VGRIQGESHTTPLRCDVLRRSDKPRTTFVQRHPVGLVQALIELDQARSR
jgi:hypothetical protein